MAYISAKDGKYEYYHFGGQFDHYFTPDFKGAVNLTYYDRKGGSNFLTLSAGLEKRITGSHWSVFGTGAFAGSSGPEMWAIRVGARAFFDPPGTTLQQHDRLVPFNGAWTTTMSH